MARKSRREDPRIHRGHDRRLTSTAEAGCAGSRPGRRRGIATPAAGALRAVALVAAVGLGALAACQPYVQGNGVFREETREVAAFEGVSAQDGIQVQITAGTAQSVKVSGDENVIQHIETTVRSDPRGFPVLDVKSSISSFDSTNPVKAVVTVPTLRYVTATHACTVGATQVAAPSFELDASDNASVTLSGAGGAAITVNLQGGQRGGAHLDARGYPVDTATVALAGGSTARLAARVGVSGTADGGSTLENSGAATCTVSASADSKVTCSP